MKQLILKTLLLMGMALLPCLAVHAANLLTNPGFVPANPNSYPDYTASAPPGWTNIGASNGPMALGLISTLTNGAVGPMQPYNGNAFMYDLGGFANPNPNVGDGLTQTFATRPGHRYRLTFGHNAEAAGSKVFETGTDALRVQVGGVDQTYASPYDRNNTGYGQACCAWQGAWTQRVLDFVASATSTRLAFAVASVSTNSYGNASVARTGSNSQIVAWPIVEEIIDAPTITLWTELGAGGRISSADQFTVSIQLAGVVQNDTSRSTTQGSGASVDPGTGTTGVFTGVAGAEYSINEVMTALSASKPGQYSATVDCSNSGVDGTDVSGVRTLGATIKVAGNDVISCKITNTPKPVLLTLTQLVISPFPVNLLPPFTFNYSINNGWPQPQALTTTTFNVPVSTPQRNLAAGNVDTTLSTNLPDARWFVSSFACADSGAPGNGNPTGNLLRVVGTSVTIRATHVRAGAVLMCKLTMGHKVP